MSGYVSDFIDQHYQHFNALTLKYAARAYRIHVDNGSKMMVTLGGAMSTAEIGISLAEMIRQDKVHAICCTGANLEEDLYRLVGDHAYDYIPEWRELSADDETKLSNRVTDTCIPEGAMDLVGFHLKELWNKAYDTEESYFPHQYFYHLIRSGKLEGYYQSDQTNSWLVAAAENDLPLFVPGWEDSTSGNLFASLMLRDQFGSGDYVMKSGLDYMKRLVRWYRYECSYSSVGMFQIGGGIAGDFPICVAPLINDELGEEIKRWSYFCQISDSTTSYGSYSGAPPNEKISWGKLDVDTPKFMIESDATIVAPLIFAYVMNK